MRATDSTDDHELHGVQAVLFVADVAMTLAYYRDALGFHVDFDYGSPPVHARVSSGDREGASAARIRFEKAPGAPCTSMSELSWTHSSTHTESVVLRLSASRKRSRGASGNSRF